MSKRMRNPGELPCRPPLPILKMRISKSRRGERRKEVLCYTGKECRWKRGPWCPYNVPQHCLPCWASRLKQTIWSLCIWLMGLYGTLTWAPHLFGDPYSTIQQDAFCMWSAEYLIHQTPQIALIIALFLKKTLTFRSSSQGEGEQL